MIPLVRMDSCSTLCLPLIVTGSRHNVEPLSQLFQDAPMRITAPSDCYAAIPKEQLRTANPVKPSFSTGQEL